MTVSYSIKPDGGKVAVSLSGAGALCTTSPIGTLNPVANRIYVACWVKLNTTSPADIGTICGVADAGQLSWTLRYDGPNFLGNGKKFYFQCSTTGASYTLATRSDNLVPSAGVWYFVEGWRDGAEIGIRVNRGTATTAVIATDPLFNSSAPFTIGARFSTFPSLIHQLEGSVDEVYVWTGSSRPTTLELDAIYNSGNGVARGEYEDLGLATPTAAWSLEEYSGLRHSWDLAHNLSEVGSVSRSTGKVVTADFTTLQAWHADWSANYDGSQEWIANCYGGGDLCGGAAAYLYGLGTETARTTITAPDAEYHAGVRGAGAFVASGLSLYNAANWTIEKLRFQACSLTYGNFAAGNLAGVRHLRNLIDGGFLYLEVSGDTATLADWLAENNLVFGTDIGFGIIAVVSASLTADSLAGIIRHNTLIGTGNGDVGIDLLGSSGGGPVALLNLAIQNNIALGFATCYSVSGFVAPTVSSAANVTSDATGEIPNQLAAAVLIDLNGGDYRVLPGGPASNTGAAAGAEVDLLGQARSTSRPDIGAWETRGGRCQGGCSRRPRLGAMGRMAP